MAFALTWTIIWGIAASGTWLLRLSARANELTDYCSGESLRAECPGQQVVVMDTVQYGRMSLGRCVLMDMGYLGCTADVTDMADNRCSGRRRCEIMVPSLEMNPRVTCLKELNLYMRANYSCVPVEHMGRSNCSKSVRVTVTGRTSHLASLVTNETGCGNQSSPWILEAQPGQVIQITLIDFSWHPVSSNKTTISGYGYEYGEAVDQATDTMVTIRGGGRDKSRHLWTSVGHTVQLMFRRQAVMDHSFLIQYKAIGCPDLVQPSDAWMERTENSLTVGCYKSKQTWHLHCKGTRWDGVIGNCTHQLARVQQLIQKSDKPRQLSHELVIALIFVTALMICLAIIAVGIFILKRNNDRGKYAKPDAYIQQISRPYNGQHMAALVVKADSRPAAYQVHSHLTRNHYGQVTDNSDLESEPTEYQLPSQDRNENIETKFTPLQKNNCPHLNENMSIDYGIGRLIGDNARLSDSGIIDSTENGSTL